jgi:16S rRNA (guanine527-N7)-methyltransferase
VSRFAERIAVRLAAAELAATAEQLEQLAAYLELLAKWSRTINLTSFDLREPSDGAIDRLVVEPAHAYQLIDNNRLVSIDIGSGGGSPSLPLKIFAPAVAYVLVESRARKCAFLREAVRVLGLADVRVEQARLEDVSHTDEARSAFDLVTMRAVRVDEALWAAVSAMLRPSGRVLWFGAREASLPGEFSVIATRLPVALLQIRAGR